MQRSQEVSGRAFQAEKIDVYKPGGKNELGGSIEEISRQCGCIMGAEGQVETYFITPAPGSAESISIKTPAISTDILTVPSNLPAQSITCWFSS